MNYATNPNIEFATGQDEEADLVCDIFYFSLCSTQVWESYSLVLVLIFPSALQEILMFEYTCKIYFNLIFPETQWERQWKRHSRREYWELLET